MKKSIPEFFSMLILLGLIFFWPEKTSASCHIITTTPTINCTPAICSFYRADFSGKETISFLWNFGDGTISTDSAYSVNHTYTKVGYYKVFLVTAYKDNTSCTDTLAQRINMVSLPMPVIFLPKNPISGTIQCFRQRTGSLNNFCIQNNSSPGSSGAVINKYLWNFGDGETSSLNYPCHSYKASGTYTVSLEITDTNFCSAVAIKKNAITVLKAVPADFTMTHDNGCKAVKYSITNISDTAGIYIRAFYWDFGDGSRWDTVHYNPVHTFEPGMYWVKLRMIDKDGCLGIDSQIIHVETVPGPVIFFKDTICWEEAKTNGMNFIAAQRPNVVFWQWSFGDPASGSSDFANYSWQTTHKFAGGPGNYQVHFIQQNTNHNCGVNGLLDTCITVHIKGPQSMILLPQASGYPANNFVPAHPMAKTEFTALANHSGSCGPQSITYSTFSYTAVKRHVTYQFCHAPILNKTVDTMADCNGDHKMPFVSSVALQPTDSVIRYYADSIETKQVWTKGNPIPSGAVYYPSSGVLNSNNIQDSNLSTCTLPNLVHFTNNSIKYRLQKQMDDNTFLNVTDPVHSLRDACLWKNYPMASDSLTYLWKFNDPSGLPCTSTVANKNQDCNFSTIAAPYHYYRGWKGLPVGRSQLVTLIVSDSVTGCSDSDRIYLNQGPPQAYWDKAAYCRMNWDMQQSGILPVGKPGPAGPPLRGFQLAGQNNACSGPGSKFRIDLSETLPQSGARQWLIVFDSAASTNYVKCPGGNDSTLDFGFTGRAKKDGYPLGGSAAFWNAAPWFGNYAYESGDTGCKTIGIVLQVGQCTDTAWYHDYICFSRLDAGFKIYNVIPMTGNAQTEYPVGLSDETHGHICQEDFSEGAKIHLYPKVAEQQNIVSYKLTMMRRQFATSYDKGTWYYNLPFWPDSATFNFFNMWTDTVGQVDHLVFNVDSAHLFVQLNLPGLPAKTHLPGFPLYKNEIDSLKARNHVNILLSDQRTRRFPTGCGKNFVTLYSDNVAISKTIPILNLSGKGAMDSVVLPYPGFYTIQAVATSLEGCSQSATYHLIYGHYAVFDASNDSIICLGQKVNFNYDVRYWSTQCPVPAGSITPPAGCTNGADEGMPMNVDFRPWAAHDPVAYRDSIVPGWSAKYKPATFQPEQIWWNFGDDKLFYPYTTGSKISHFYKKPGVYTVTMRTIDWRGCAVTTVRKNLVKVIQVVSDFELAYPGDTLNFCAPKSIMLVSRSKILGNSYHEKVIKRGLIVDSLYQVDSILTEEWSLGDGRRITKYHSDTVIFDYTDNGVYTVGLTVSTNHGCIDTKIKIKYITISGPNPKFEPVTPLSGCSPMTLVLRNHNTKNVMFNEWHIGDDTTGGAAKYLKTFPPSDSIVTFYFTQQRGRYRIHVTQSDSFMTIDGLNACTKDWPEPNDSVQYWLNINPNSVIRISGDRVLSKNNLGKWSVKSGYGEYKKYTWDFGNGKKLYFTNDSVQTEQYTESQCEAAPKDDKGRAVFTVYVSALTDSGCLKTDTFNVHVYFDDQQKALINVGIYPNPFHTETTVFYTLTRTTKITADLVDAIGREVRLIENETKTAGTYSFTINSTDQLLRSGVYLLRMVTEDGTVVKYLVKI